MKWNGIVSQRENTRMQIRLTTENSTHATSTQATRQGQMKVPRARAACAVARRLAPRVKARPAGSECHSPADSGVRGRCRLAPPAFRDGSSAVASSSAAASRAAAAGDGSGAMIAGVCWRGRNRAPSLRPVATVCRSRPAVPSLRGELVSLTTNRLDQVETEFRAEAADADIDHVGAGIEVIPPHRGEQLPFGHRLPYVLHELTQ